MLIGVFTPPAHAVKFGPIAAPAATEEVGRRQSGSWWRRRCLFWTSWFCTWSDTVKTPTCSSLSFMMPSFSSLGRTLTTSLLFAFLCVSLVSRAQCQTTSSPPASKYWLVFSSPAVFTAVWVHFILEAGHKCASWVVREMPKTRHGRVWGGAQFSLDLMLFHSLSLTACDSYKNCDSCVPHAKVSSTEVTWLLHLRSRVSDSGRKRWFYGPVLVSSHFPQARAGKRAAPASTGKSLISITYYNRKSFAWTLWWQLWIITALLWYFLCKTPQSLSWSSCWSRRSSKNGRK